MKNKWVNVKERLPEISGKYMVSDTFYVSCGWFHSTTGTFYAGDLKSPFLGITHWQPLPALPQPEVIVGA